MTICRLSLHLENTENRKNLEEKITFQLGTLSQHGMSEPPRGGGYSQKNWVGVGGPLPKTLTLFMTKICDFPYPIYDLTKN